MPTTLRIIFFAFVAVSLLGCNPTTVEAQNAETAARACTTPPAIMDNWKKEVMLELGTSRPSSEYDFRRYVDSVRSTRVANLRNPFEPLGPMNEAQRALVNERVLWENGKVMVLVDRFNPPPKVLVVPKAKGVWLPTDADASLVDELANVAAGASDAIQAVVYQRCEAGSTEIRINGPQETAVQQLHIHVYPTKASNSTLTVEDTTTEVARNLRIRLGSP
jgi:diadenosine tetraphosphate (Ap4A) HIT family hydrolase